MNLDIEKEEDLDLVDKDFEYSTSSMLKSALQILSVFRFVLRLLYKLMLQLVDE